ncbi:MAG TPA: ABC transporter ATP-binding protein [Phycisphaerae bacterium]|nr:ABC transporter ATP-binding protein [Phycisphaerae bacterium]
MIQTKKLTKYYGSLAALVDLDLEIRPGDIFGFIGPNGAGKTTTMRILATLLEPSRGSATIDGVDVLRHGKQVRRMVGYMPDFMRVYDDLKVFEYLEFFAAAFGIERRKRKAVVDGVLELTDLTGKSAATVDSLSRGMQQRLGLARVLIHDPKALILDEPASGLDPRARIEMRMLLKELKGMGKTIMISSHILSELEEICDHVGIIERGRMVFSGTLEEIRRKLGIHCKVRVRVAGDPARAVELLVAVPGIKDARVLGDAVAVEFGDGQIPDGIIARTLVGGGVNVISLVPEQVKLDDAFLQLTQGLVQ